MNSLKWDKRRILGRRITRVEMNKFRDGDAWAYDPIIYLDNGKIVRFEVKKTKTGKFSITLIVTDEGELEGFP